MPTKCGDLQTVFQPIAGEPAKKKTATGKAATPEGGKELYAMRSNKDGRDIIFDFPGPNPPLPNTKPINVSQLSTFNFDDTEALLATNPNQFQTDRQAECISGHPKGSSGGVKGVLTGIGPSCSPGERGLGEFHQCLTDAAKDCWGQFYVCMYAAPNITTGKLPERRTNTTSMCQTQVKDCIKQAKEDCACEDCLYEFGDTTSGGGSTGLGFGGGSTGSTDATTDTTTNVNDTTNPGTSESRKVPQLKSVTATSSEYFVARPEAFGRSILTGNIFWTGDVQTESVKIRTVENHGTTATYVETDVTVPRAAFAVGICAGEVAGILRMWVGDVLILSNVLETDENGVVQTSPTGDVIDEIENSLLFSNGTNDPVYYDTSKMRITLFSGREDQVAPAIMGSNAPAYRGLAYVLIENFNLSYAGNRFPRISVEVVQKITSEAPRQTYEEITIDPDYWIVDRSMNTIYVPTTDLTVKRIALDTLTEVDTLTAPSPGIAPRTVLPISGGNLLFQRNTANQARITYMMDPDNGTIIKQWGIENNAIDPSFAYQSQLTEYAFQYRNDLSPTWRGPYAQPPDGRFVTETDYFALTTFDGFVRFYNFDQVRSDFTKYFQSLPGYDPFAEFNCTMTCYYDCYYECYTANGCTGDFFETPCEIACDDACFSSCADQCADLIESTQRNVIATAQRNDNYGSGQFKTQYYSFSIPGGATQDKLICLRSTIMDSAISTNPLINFYIDNAYTADNNYEMIIPAAEWGGLEQLYPKFGFVDNVNNAMVIFIGAIGEEDIAVSLSFPDLSIRWMTRYAGLPNKGHVDGRSPMEDYWFVDVNSNVAKLDLATGTITVVSTLADYGVPDFETGNQYFDYYTRSLIYYADGALNKVYLDRHAPGVFTVADAILAMCEKAGISHDLVDVTDISSIEITGYSLEAGTRPGDAIDQLCRMFAITGYEAGTGLVFVRNLPSGPVAELTSDDYSDGGFERTTEDPFSSMATFRFVYGDINNLGKPTSQTIKQAVATVGHLDDTQTSQYSAPILFADDSEAMKVAERMYAYFRLPTTQGTLKVGRKNLRLLVGDVVRIDNRDWRIKTIDLYTDLYDALLTVEIDKAYVNDFLTVKLPSTTVKTAQSSSPNVLNMQARAFCFPPIYEADRVAVGTKYSVFYVGVQKKGLRADFTDVTTAYRLVAEQDTFSTGPTLSETLNVGRLVAFSSAHVSSLGVSDETSSFTVEFDGGDTLAFLATQTQYTLDDLVEADEVNRIMIGRELMAWGQYSISGNQVTFTKLLRGLSGTEVLFDTHVVGEQVVLATPGSLKPVYVDQGLTEAHSSPVAVKIYSWGNVSQDKRVTVIPWDNLALKHPAPVHVKRFSADNGDMLLTWDRRDLYGDGATLKLSPDFEVYDAFTDAFPVPGSVNTVAPLWGEQYAVTIYTFNPGTYPSVETFHDNYWRGTGFTGGFNIITDTPSIYIKKATLTTLGVNNSSQLWIVVSRLGGPNMRVNGRLTIDRFPAGTYPPVPPVNNVAVAKESAYAVLTPSSTAIYHVMKYVVTRKIT